MSLFIINLFTNVMDTETASEHDTATTVHNSSSGAFRCGSLTSATPNILHVTVARMLNLFLTDHKTFNFLIRSLNICNLI